jgi:hypothetical protein
MHERYARVDDSRAGDGNATTAYARWGAAGPSHEAGKAGLVRAWPGVARLVGGTLSGLGTHREPCRAASRRRAE